MANQDETLLVLVNEQDEAIGTMEKMEVHRKALLHRAFSVFIFNSKGEMLLQRGLYRNTTVGGYGPTLVAVTLFQLKSRYLLLCVG